MTTPLLVANWKMNKTVAEAVDTVQEFLPLVRGVADRQIVLAPPFTALYAVGCALRGSPVMLAAQNMHWENDGAFTGEISPVMLKDLGCRFVIVGHSERRQYFGEGEGEAARKVGAALREGVTPILCVGETLAERDYGKTFEIVERQIRGGLEGSVIEKGGELVVAYEPVWAIGTGRSASPEAAQEVHGFIRGLLAGLVGETAASAVRILYGGSVKPDNAGALMGQKDIDGALVGGASLNAQSFARIVSSAAAR